MARNSSFSDLPDGPRPKRRALARLSHALSESVAVIPQTGAGAPADLGARFSSVLSGLDGRTVGTDALFESLKLEVLDWAFDQGLDARLIDADEQPVAAGDGKEEA